MNKQNDKPRFKSIEICNHCQWFKKENKEDIGGICQALYAGSFVGINDNACKSFKVNNE